MPTGTAALKQLVLDQIAQVELSGEAVGEMCGWDDMSAYLMRYCLRVKILDEGDLRVAIHLRLKTLGRYNYELYRTTPTPPDHVISPHAFAYAIRNDVFTQAELKNIEFDHGETLETFMAGHIHDLPQKVLGTLVRWRPPKSRVDGLGYPVCC